MWYSCISRPARRIGLALLAALPAAAASAAPVHTTYLWHLHQPIYWPDQRSAAPDRYEYAYDTISAKGSGRAYPFDEVATIFGSEDRKAAYQYRPWDSISAVLAQPDAGAQITYSGALMENVGSLGAASWNGYGSGWANSFITGRNASTATGSKPRLDMVNFTYHHSLAPLQTPKTFEMELRLLQRKMEQVWGTGRPVSRGYFPTEMAFSRHLIPVLKAQGIDWSIVSGNHLSRACTDFPLVLGSGGENCQPPNKSDILNPAQGAESYYRRTIERGCSPCNAAPFAYTPHQAQWVNPDTGAVEKLVVVPAAQEFSWADGYGCFGTGDSGFQSVAAKNPDSPERPQLIVLAHDGDNAFGGGYSYYMECVPNFVSGAVTNGHRPSTVEKYLLDYPVPETDVVHVEDGAWVNADGDFGSPTFINWNYPLLDSSGQIDPVNGWHEKPREYAVFLAAENRVRTAEQVAGEEPNLDRILDPGLSGTTAVERAWHYYLGSLDSGQVYYGAYGDVEIKAAVGCNEAVEHADSVLSGSFTDQTTPSVWLPQRWPYNPGAVNFGVETQYQQKVLGPDFTVWTFAYDVSGVTGATLKWRTDADGQNPLPSTQNETYAGGAEVGAWQSTPMAIRTFPKGNIYNKPELNFSELPAYIADHCSAQIAAQAGKLIDYYVEVVDGAGNVTRSPIQHVWVGEQTGPGGGGIGDPAAVVVPTTPVAGQQVRVEYETGNGPLAGAASVRLHWGTNNWGTVASPDPSMTWNPTETQWETTITLPAAATQLDVVFNNGASTWDNNGGADWHFPVSGASAPKWIIDGQAESDSLIAAHPSGALRLYAANDGNVLYVGTDAATSAGGRDHFILLAAAVTGSQAAPWAKAGTTPVWDAFLAHESTNSFSGWFSATGALINDAWTAKAAGSVVEGSIDLTQLYAPGPVPSAVYLAVLPYATSDGGALAPAFQSPATVNSNAHADSAEFYLYTLQVPATISEWSVY